METPGRSYGRCACLSSALRLLLEQRQHLPDSRPARKTYSDQHSKQNPVHSSLQRPAFISDRMRRAAEGQCLCV